MISKDREIELYLQMYPKKENANPWKPQETIRCMDLVARYKVCVGDFHSQGRLSLANNCKNLKQIALNCYLLEPKYFLQASKDLLQEDYYLDLYITKQLNEPEQKKVFKMKDPQI